MAASSGGRDNKDDSTKAADPTMDLELELEAADLLTVEKQRSPQSSPPPVPFGGRPSQPPPPPASLGKGLRKDATGKPSAKARAKDRTTQPPTKPPKGRAPAGETTSQPPPPPLKKPKTKTQGGRGEGRQHTMPGVAIATPKVRKNRPPRKKKAVVEEGKGPVDPTPSEAVTVPAVDGEGVVDRPSLPTADDLVVTLEAELEHLGDDSHRRAMLLYEIGRIQEERQNDPRAARVRYRAALDADPDKLPALRGLRRLEDGAGNTAEAIRLLEAEIRLTSDDRQRSCTSAELGRTLEAKGEPDRAIAAYRRALELHGGSQYSVEALIALYQAQKQWVPLSEILLRAAGNTTDQGRKALLTSRAASIREALLDQEAASEALLATALGHDHELGHIAEELARIYRKRGRWAELAELERGEALRAETDEARALYLYRAGRLFADRAGDAAAAEECFAESTKLAPEMELPRLAIAEVQRHRGDFEALEATLVAGIERLRDRDRAVAARFELARLRADRLDNQDGAVEALHQALELDPRHVVSLRALEDILVEQGRFDELVEVAAAEVDRLKDEGARADAYHELGHLVERHLDDGNRAAFFYRAALDLVSDHAASFEALERLYARQQAWEELCDLLERSAESTPDETRAATRLARAAELAEHRLGDLDRAAALARRVLALRSGDLEAISRLGRLLEASGAWQERIDLLWKEVDLARHSPERLALMMRIAALVEVRLAEPDRARGVYRKVLVANPAHTAALRALARLDRRAGRFEDLLSTLRLELAAGLEEEDAALVQYRIGRLLEEKLGRTEEAIDAYRAALAEDPTYGPAADALDRLLRALSRWDEATELLETLATSPLPTKQARAMAWYRVGELREERLGDDEGAAAAYRDALKLMPDQEPARQGILRILEGAGRWPEVAQVLEAEAEQRGGRRRLSALLRLASLRSVRLKDPAGALAALAEAEADAPDSLAVQEALAVAAREQRDWDRLGRAYGKLADAMSEPGDAAAILHRAALDARAHPAVGDPVALYRRILDLTPDDGAALAALEETALSSADPELLLEVTSRRLLVEPSEELRLPLLLRQGDLRSAAPDVPGAMESFERALALAPSCLAALRGLAGLKTASGDDAGLADLREREAGALADPEARTRAFVEAGEIRLGRLDDKDGALRCFEKVLEISPSHKSAYHRLTAVLEGAERWQELAEAMTTRLASVTEESEEVTLRLHLASIQRDKLDKAEDAVGTLKGLLAVDPKHSKALETLGELYARLERWREASEAYAKAAKEAESRKDGKAAHRCRIALAELQLRRLAEYDEAAGTVAAALERTPGDLGTLRLHVEVQKKRGDVPAAASALRALVDALGRGDRAPVLIELADLLDTEADDPGGAAEALQRAAADSPGDRSPVQRLQEHFGKLGDWEGLARALAWAVDHAGGDATTTALLRVELARALIEKQGRVAAGVEHLEAVLEAQPSNAAARFAMAHRHMLPPGRPDLAEHELRRILDFDPWNLDAQRELFRLLATGKSPDRAHFLAALLAYLGDAEAAAAGAHTAQWRQAMGARGYDDWVADAAEPALMCGLLRMVQSSLEKVYPLDLERHGASREDRAGQGDALTAAVAQVANRLGAGPCETFISHRNRNACAVEPGDPARVVVGVNLTSYPAAVRRFEIGRALGPLIGGSLLFGKVPRRELPALLSAIIGAMVKGYNRMGDPDEVYELTRRVSRAMPRKLKKQIEETARRAAAAALPDLDGWVEASDRSADRCGLLACADIAAALEAVRARDEARLPTRHETTDARLANLRGYGPAEELVRFWLSPRCEQALGLLGTP